MIKHLAVVVALCLAAALAFAQPAYINTIRVPDIAGFQTLKCDLHVHTVFSDGEVWPTFRVMEAAAEGLDAIAITDHVEYQPHKEHVSTDRNVPFKIAQSAPAAGALILIPGAEITRPMPPGHLNALFVRDANALAKETWRETVDEAVKQGALIFWNHPGWEGQQPDRVSRWYDEQSELLSRGIMKGIEIVNHKEYYPAVFAWCLEKKIAILGNSDTHSPIDYEFGTEPGRLRPITLVFARERTAESIKEAIFERRTAVIRGKELFGEEQWLKQIFEKSISYSATKVALTGRSPQYLFLTNNSDVPYSLELVQCDSAFRFPPELELAPGKTALFPIRALIAMSMSGPVTAVYEVKNLLVGPGKTLRVPLTFDVDAKAK